MTATRASERPEVIPQGWAEPQRRPNPFLLLQSAGHWGPELGHKGSPKMAASAGHTAC